MPTAVDTHDASPANKRRFPQRIAALMAFTLAACQASDDAKSLATAPVADASSASVVPDGQLTTNAAAVSPDDEDTLSKPRPDASYTKANLRPRYDECVTAAGGVTPELSACGDEELAYHEEQLAGIVEPVIDSPDGIEKDKWLEDQAAWWEDTKRNCAWNPATDGQGQMLDAQSCRINRVVNRVEELKRRSSNP